MLFKYKLFTMAIILLSLFSCSHKKKPADLIREGIHYRDLGNYTKAIELYTEAYNLDSLDYGAGIRLGSLYSQTNRYGNAIYYYTRSLRLKPNYTAYQCRGECYLLIQQYDRAVKDFDSSLILHPANPIVLSHLATSHIKLGDELLAEKELRQAVTLNHSNKTLESDKQNESFLYAHLGVILVNKGLNYSAIDYASRAILMDSTNFEAYNIRATAYLMKKMCDSALTEAQHALKIVPDFGAAYITVAKVYYSQNKKELMCSVIDSAEKYGSMELEDYHDKFCR